VAITEQGLRNGMVSVRLSRHGPEHQTLLPAGDIDRLLHGAQQRGGTVPLPRCQRTQYHRHRLVTSCVQNTLNHNNLTAT